MKRNKQILSGLLLAIPLMILILDSKTSIQGAKDGISLCISVVIPSLFPFLFISAMLPGRLIGNPIKGATRLCRACCVPYGAQSLLVLSFLAGYPVGAGMVADAYRQGRISRSAAERMLGFCNNAGPAFLFGMVSRLFADQKAVFLLWFIHILSALLVGIVLPNKVQESCTLNKKTPTSLNQALETSLKSMGNICGWVVIFRVVISVLDRWLLWIFPQELQATIYGLLELSNGIINLQNLSNHGGRFIACSGILAFGGLCVLMQTVSVTKGLGLGLYFPGKVLHCMFSVFLSMFIQYLLFPLEQCIIFPSAVYIILIIAIATLIFLLQRKKIVAKPEQILYNDVKSGT